MVRNPSLGHIGTPVAPASAARPVAQSAIRPIRRSGVLPYDDRVISDSVRTCLAEPAVADPPARVWRDWAVAGAVVVGAVLETVLRTDAKFVGLPVGWRVASLVTCLVSIPVAILIRRTRPLAALLLAFGVILGFGAVARLVEGSSGGLNTGAVALVMVYSLYRWGSGRDWLIGGGVLLVALVVGNLVDGSSVGDVIGGGVVLLLPVLIGLNVRSRQLARDRAVTEARANERVTLARELHDTVAHHVSAIAVQAQAGRAVAANSPERAVEILAVIEEAASRALEDMRAMVHTLRAGADAELNPGTGLVDIPRLAQVASGALHVTVDIDAQVGDVTPAVGTALYRLAQESITNAVRHARKATHVRVHIAGDNQQVSITVVDDGEQHVRGTAARTAQGYGLLGMAERVKLLGGTFTAGPLPGRGWQVQAQLPRTVMS